MVEHTFDELLAKLSLYIKNQENIDFIVNAYNFASELHKGQIRKSGQPYIIHPVEVAYILASYQTGPITIVAGLLHDVIEDCNVKREQLKEMFNEEVASLIEAVTKIRRLPEISDIEEVAAASHRKLIVAMANDVRAILIKLADRLHNMRTLDYMTAEKQEKISKETLKIYAPLAHRLGLGAIKAEIEDLALKYLEPSKYATIEKLIKENIDNETSISKLQSNINSILNDSNISHTIYGRMKHFYSIYKKMYIKNKQFAEIYDIQAVRVVTDTIAHCYEVLGLIHSNYRPIPGRFKDYIAMPKPNMYQSLHTTIIDEFGGIYEVQIRTEHMDKVADSGVAAHWNYKENNNYNYKQEQKEIEEKLHWFRELIIYTDEVVHDSYSEYVTSLQKDIFEANVYVLTPKGKVIDLPAEATPLDFAYRIHSGVGDKAVGAIVNKLMVPLNTILKTGDIVEIKTNKNSQGPFEDWLKIVKSTSAKYSIKKGLARKQQTTTLTSNDYIVKGKEIINEEIKKQNYPSKETLELLNNKQFISQWNCGDIEKLYEKLGNGNLKISSLNQQIKNKFSDINLADAHIISVLSKKRKTIANSTSSIIVSNLTNLKYSLSQCCTPIPGDEVIGYISRGEGIKIHVKGCHNVTDGDGRTIDVSWNENMETDAFFLAKIILEVAPRRQLLVDIMAQLSGSSAEVIAFDSKSSKDSLSNIIKVSLKVRNKENLDNIIVQLKNISDVKRVERIKK